MFKKVGMVRSCIQNWSLIYQYKIHQMHIDVYVNQLFAAQIKVNFWVMEMRPSNSHSSNLAFPYKCARHWSRGVHCTKHVQVYVSAQDGYWFGPCRITYTYDIHVIIYSYIHIWKAFKKYTIIVLVWLRV